MRTARVRRCTPRGVQAGGRGARAPNLVPLSLEALDGRAHVAVVDALAVQDDQQLSRLRVLAAACSGRVSGGWRRTTRCRAAAAARLRWRVWRGGRVIGLSRDVRPDEWLTHDVALLPDTRKPAAGDAGGERRAVRVTDVLKV
jgi:hypothetical protein